ncbi:MAG: hypothetical protein DRP51_06025, partial [Candidatus Zixiibacteriota bacterium]
RYHIVTASITQDQARIIFDTVVRILNGSCRIEGLVRRMTATPYPRLVLGNGAIIEARSTQRRGQYLLGHDYDYFIFDEVAFEQEAEFVVNEVIKMRLADRMGKLDLVSTPNGKNWFYRKMKALKDRPDKAYVQSGDSRENKYISKEYLQIQIEYLSDKRVAQNIMGMFVDSGGEIVPGRYVDEALIKTGIANSSTGRSQPLRLRQYYLSGWDLARKRTATVGITIEVVDDIATVVELTRIRKWDWNIILEAIRRQQRTYPGRLIIDATGLGDVVVSQLGDLNPTSFIFTGKSKAELLTNLELFHSMRKIKYARWELPDENGRVWSLEDELRAATWEDNNQCDAVMALALALWPLRQPNKPILNAKVGVV